MDEQKAFDILKSVFMAGLRRVDPVSMMKAQLCLTGDELTIDTGTERHVLNLTNFRRILVTGMGKASARMALGLEQVLGDRIDSGVVAVKYGHTEDLRRINLVEAGHPVPDEASVVASEKILACVKNARNDDLVINLVSGGGSSVMCSPYRGADNWHISLADKQSVSALLLSCGAGIHEINCIRKHLSNTKGGRLAESFYPAQSVSLILSDVVGDDLDTIASGATIPDPTIFTDALNIIGRYNLTKKMPAAVMELFHAGAAGKVPDTPKPGNKVFEKTLNILIGTNLHALSAAAEEARRLGVKTEILTSVLTGEAREIAHFFSAITRYALAWRKPAELPVCFISGGETTVTLKGNGLGGRNMEMVLSFLNDLHKSEKFSDRIFFLSAGTDGSDGPTDAAGAFASACICAQAEQLGLDPEKFIAENDSWNFFDKAGGLFRTGPTGTNVCDIQLLLVT
jgi:hydroxypyruvate reductase